MPVLKLEFQGTPIHCGISKVDRSKLYGYTKTEILDDRGRPCKSAILASDGRTLIPAGGVALAYISPSGIWRDKSDLKAVGLNGKPIEPVPSTFNQSVALDREASFEELLDHNIRMVYALSPEDGSSFPGPLLDQLGSGKIFSFPFSYRGGMTADTAFLMEGADESIWMLIGKETDIHLLSRDQIRGFTEEESEDDEEEDLDFNMF